MEPINRFLLRHPVGAVAAFCLVGLSFVSVARSPTGAEPYSWSPIAALAIMGHATAVPVFTPRLFKMRPDEMLLILLGFSIFPTGMALWSIGILGVSPWFAAIGYAATVASLVGVMRRAQRSAAAQQTGS